MAEVTTNVYDLLFPSPPDLKELATISIAVKLWRQEINTHRIKNTLSELDLEKDILSCTLMPGLPSSILSDIEKYVKRFGMAIQAWLKFHERIFKNEIFNDFIDFVGDFDGTIHYVRTAKRIVQCDRVDDVLKFNIACRYCFEDDILRIWPLVSDYVKKLSISRDRRRLPFYWVCRLKNQQYKIPVSNHSFEEDMLGARSVTFNPPSSSLTWSSVEYFWNCLDVNARTRIAMRQDYGAAHFTRILCRYLIQIFDEVLLDRFIKERACQVLTDSLHTPLFRNDSRRLYIMATWEFLKNKMDTSTFVFLVKSIVGKLCGGTEKNDKSVYAELWTTTPDHLKRYAIQTISKDNSLISMYYRPEFVDIRIEKDPDLFAFLYAVLSDASAEDRRLFWGTHWSNLMHVLLMKSLNQLMSLCFGNDENEIFKFKLESLSKLENVGKNIGLGLLSKRYFEDLNELLNFCSSDEGSRGKFKRNLLRHVKFTYEDSKREYDRLNDFINDAYDNASQNAEFRTQPLSSQLHSINEVLAEYCGTGRFHHAVQFIEALAPSEQVAIDVKRRQIFPRLQQILRERTALIQFEERQFLNLLRDCLDSDDRIARFIQTFNADEIVKNVIVVSMSRPGDYEYNCFLVEFLEWYFITPQVLDEFRSRYADDEVFVRLTTKNE